MDGYLEQNDQSLTRVLNSLIQPSDGALHWETAGANLLMTFQTWMYSEVFDNVKSIHWQLVEMILKACASQIEDARKKGS
jgi:hypothetical protein